LLECADCRECVALASAVEEEQTVGTALGAHWGGRMVPRMALDPVVGDGLLRCSNRAAALW
jgi:hypothetical protein